MEYMTIKDVSKKWGISERRIQKLCAQNRIDGAERFGRVWAIPEDTMKPCDGRITTGEYVKDTEGKYTSNLLDSGRQYGVVYTPDQLAMFLAEVICMEVKKDDFKIGTVLDPACGEAALLAAMEQSAETINCVGIDVDKDAILSASLIHQDRISFINDDAIIPKEVVGSTVDFWKNKIGKVSVVIANPPWSSEKIYSSRKLVDSGFTLAAGQYDSYVLFLEYAYGIVEDGGYFGFIIPDSLFESQNELIRRFLAENTQIKLIARLGEKIFKGVNRATTVIICKKQKPEEKSTTKCFRLNTDDRKKFLRNELKLIDAYKNSCHEVNQSRFLKDRNCIFDIDTRDYEESLLRKITAQTIEWNKEFKFGRGVEISKSGELIICDNCNTAQGYKLSQLKAGSKRCTSCGSEVELRSEKIVKVISDKPNGNWAKLFVGEHIQRYSSIGEKYIQPKVKGIKYKSADLYTGPKILFRKTGLGIKAYLDRMNTLTSQTVYILRQIGDESVPIEYYLALINSRVVYYYYLKMFGENEWKSHPYFTKEIIFSLPIKKYESTRLTGKICSLAGDLQENYSYEKDIELERYIFELYGLSKSEIEYVKNEINGLPDLSAINEMKMMEFSDV